MKRARSMPCASRVFVAVLGLVLFPIVSSAAWADDEAPAEWSQRASAVPSAPATQGNDDPRCRESERPAETREDRAETAKGWRLFHEYAEGWDLKVIWALSGYHGMCRP